MKPKLRALVQTTTAEGGTHSQHRLAWPPYASQTRTGLPRRHPQDQNTSAERQFFSLSAVFGATPGPPHARRREQMSIVPTPTPRHAIRPHSSPIQISPRPARQPPRLQVHRHRPHARRTFFLPPPFPPRTKTARDEPGAGHAVQTTVYHRRQQAYRWEQAVGRQERSSNGIGGWFDFQANKKEDRIK